MAKLNVYFLTISLCSFALAAQEASTKPVIQPTPVATPKLEPILRQDLTGEGTFHRQGLLRQQEAVREAAASVTPPSPTALPTPPPSPSPEPPETP